MTLSISLFLHLDLTAKELQKQHLNDILEYLLIRSEAESDQGPLNHLVGGLISPDFDAFAEFGKCQYVRLSCATCRKRRVTAFRLRSIFINDTP
jgi:hypothetical protein